MTSPSTLPSSLGNIDATLHNLERAVLVNYSKLSDGRPTITLLGQTAQSPYPELVLTTELIENLNQIALGAMVKCTKALIEAQLAVMDKLIAEREALPDDWTPTPEGLEAASKITKLKSFKSTTFVSKPIPGGVQTFLHPEDGVSMTSIQPNPEASRIQNTGFRPALQGGAGAPTGPAPPRGGGSGNQGGARPRSRPRSHGPQDTRPHPRTGVPQDPRSYWPPHGHLKPTHHQSLLSSPTRCRRSRSPSRDQVSRYGTPYLFPEATQPWREGIDLPV
jgi:hypothetical protein